MDLIILILLIIAVAVLYRDFKFVTYLFGILEIFFRLIHYIGDNIPLININPFVNKYIPSSLFSIIEKYTTGIVYDIISWLFILIFAMFLFYLVRYFIKKK
ncbi:MAG: hypothetical protein ACI31R_05095 [Bacilli bacterium]